MCGEKRREGARAPRPRLTPKRKEGEGPCFPQSAPASKKEKESRLAEKEKSAHEGPAQERKRGSACSKEGPLHLTLGEKKKVKDIPLEREIPGSVQKEGRPSYKKEKGTLVTPRRKKGEEENAILLASFEKTGKGSVHFIDPRGGKKEAGSLTASGVRPKERGEFDQSDTLFRDWSEKKKT